MVELVLVLGERRKDAEPEHEAVQQYVVYGLLRTADAVSPNIVAAAVLSSLIIYAAAYAFVFGAGIWYLGKLLHKGPVKQPPKDTEGGEKTPARPLSLPDEPIDGGAA